MHYRCRNSQPWPKKTVVIFGIAKVSVTKRNPKLLTRRKQPTHELQKARNNERDLNFFPKDISCRKLTTRNSKALVSPVAECKGLGNKGVPGQKLSNRI
jgi:hypothetical protein